MYEFVEQLDPYLKFSNNAYIAQTTESLRKQPISKGLMCDCENQKTKISKISVSRLPKSQDTFLM